MAAAIAQEETGYRGFISIHYLINRLPGAIGEFALKEPVEPPQYLVQALVLIGQLQLRNYLLERRQFLEIHVAVFIGVRRGIHGRTRSEARIEHRQPQS